MNMETELIDFFHPTYVCDIMAKYLNAVLLVMNIANIFMSKFEILLKKENQYISYSLIKILWCHFCGVGYYQI